MFPTARPRPSRSRLRVEPLEGRDVPAAALDPLATFTGDVTAPRDPGWVQLQVQTTSDRVLLSFESEPADGSAFRPGGVRVFAGDGAQGRAAGPAGRPGFALRDVSSGPFFARVAGAGGSTGAFEMTVGLAGDVTGDRQVTAEDLEVIRGLHGRRAGQEGFLAAADVNHNGVIGRGDLRLATRNLGESATVGPMTVDHLMFAGSAALRLGEGSPRAYDPATAPDISLVTPPTLSPDPLKLNSFSWGVYNTGGTGGTGGAGAGKPVMTDLHVTKDTDAASPKLFGAVTTGRHFPEVTLYVGRRTPAGASYPYLEWTLEDVLVTSYQVGGSDGGTVVDLNEAVSFTFSKITFTLTPKLPNGKPGTPVSASYDFSTLES